MSAYFYIAATILGTVASHIFIKSGVNGLKHFAGHDTLRFVIRALFEPFILLGLGCAFFSAIMWILAMRHFPLSFAYPFTALTIMLVALAGALIFHEQLPSLYGLSLGLIVIALGILAFAK